MDETLSLYELSCVAKHFDTTSQFVNLMKTCKKYSDICDVFFVNPIPLDEQNEKLFRHLTTQQITSEDAYIPPNKKNTLWFKKTNYKVVKPFESNDNIMEEVTYRREDYLSFGIEVPHCVNTIGTKCFENCNGPMLVNTISGSVKKIDLFTKVIIPDLVNTLDSFAFHNCTQLTEVSLTPSITKIGEKCFENCCMLSKISGIEGENSALSQLGKGCFKNCVSLVSIAFPPKVSILPEKCFDNCNSLAEITAFPQLIGHHCFNNCNSLKTVSFFGIGRTKEKTVVTIQMIGYKAFAGCRNLVDVRLNSAIGEFGVRCFEGCISLTNVSPLPKIRGADCFKDCKLLNLKLDGGENQATSMV
ncbi:hypothetical protein EIN_377210 [Entamoeba invadens IP1]|uniref:Leucine rich repeat containing protein BspA family protein n=1 Tax=Entamoeba invadens IP1 TaxID=370355 RepID=A0A0A1TYC3_ENTIV|nr:hypothetical protein EIN_377210 [Entamoeba invadens IP1]ELP83496.1 hypothetical protein EIN_377210 [Entamoeba invadens IP1]|eukprot:XP_004182842.1 hypothetical protein EIN_377210 [Entamoeba invadens IP1]